MRRTEMINILKSLGAILITFVLTYSLWGCHPSATPDVQKEEVHFEVINAEFKTKDYSIVDFGAKKGGELLNTEAINNTILHCSSKGGGRVIIPEGIWLTGPLKMASNVNLHVSTGAILLFTPDVNQYPYVKSFFEGKVDYRAHPSIYGVELENVAITGKGIIDGFGEAWRPVKRFKTTDKQWNALIESGGQLSPDGKVWWPSKEAFEASINPGIIYDESLGDEVRNRYKHYYRAPLVQLVNCKYVELNGPIFQNSPGWNIHLMMSKHVTVKDIFVRNPWYSQNGDGIDLESCEYVKVTESHFDVGDDAICIKSGKNKEGRERGMPCQYIKVDNCIVNHGHGGFVIGSEMSGGVKNIWVTNCSFINTDVGLRFKSARGRGGVVENIFIENIRMKNIVKDAIIFNMFYEGLAPTEVDGRVENRYIDICDVTEETPEFKNIHIKDIVCVGAERAIYIQGLPEMPVNEVSVKNSTFISDKGAICNYVEKIVMEDVKMITNIGSAFYLKSASQVMLSNINGSQDMLLEVGGVESNNITLRSAVEGMQGRTRINPEVMSGAVSFSALN